MDEPGPRTVSFYANHAEASVRSNCRETETGDNTSPDVNSWGKGGGESGRACCLSLTPGACLCLTARSLEFPVRNCRYHGIPGRPPSLVFPTLVCTVRSTRLVEYRLRFAKLFFDASRASTGLEQVRFTFFFFN